MPSLPTSLIVVGLVAAWLVVLVPMVAKRREHVPQSDEDAAGFRVLRRASASLRRRRPVLSRTAVAARDDSGDEDLDDGDVGDGRRRGRVLDDEDLGDEDVGQGDMGDGDLGDGDLTDADVDDGDTDRGHAWGSDEWDDADERDQDDDDTRADARADARFTARDGGVTDGRRTRAGDDLDDGVGGFDDVHRTQDAEMAEAGVLADEVADGPLDDYRDETGDPAGDGTGDPAGDEAVVGRFDDRDHDEMTDPRTHAPHAPGERRAAGAGPRPSAGERVLARPGSRGRSERLRATHTGTDEQPSLYDDWDEAEDPRHRPVVRDAADEWASVHPGRRSSDPRRSADPRARRDRHEAWRDEDRRDEEQAAAANAPWRGHDRHERGAADLRGHDRPDRPERHDRPERGERDSRDEAGLRGEERLRPVPVRPGRGGFDPEMAEQNRAYRYRQRRRVVLLLVALMALGAVAGVVGFGLAWAGTVTAGILLALYLAYLRRQVRIEEDIRRRRAARLDRARQIRPVYRASVAEQVRAHRTGGLVRPEGDVPAEPYRVTSHARPSVPPVYRTRGVPVDLDDDDPAFDDLEYYRPVTYRRAAGE